MAPRLSFYSNGWISLLAPRGWHCQGGVGSDGNLSLSVLPLYVSQVTTDAAAITAIRQANGPAVSTACPFFPEMDYPGLPCTKIPARERVQRLTAKSVLFQDPPGVKGDGWPSGGPYPANGALVTSEFNTITIVQGSKRRKVRTKAPEANEETCTLPQTEHAFCTAILNDFLRRYRL